MKLAETQDADEIRAIYQYAVREKPAFGLLDWPDPFPGTLVEELIGSGALYCFQESGVISAVSRITPETHNSTDALHLDMFARSHSVRDTEYFGRVMLPEIYSAFPDTESLTIECENRNPRLKNFLESLGFFKIIYEPDPEANQDISEDFSTFIHIALQPTLARL